jgi:hypothetical protein
VEVQTSEQRATNLEPEPENFESKLRRLERLKVESLITEDEYLQKRSEILNEKW